MKSTVVGASRRQSKLPPFVYLTTDITPERVRQFAEAPERTQLLVLGYLRRESASARMQVFVNVLVVALAYIAIIFGIAIGATPAPSKTMNAAAISGKQDIISITLLCAAVVILAAAWFFHRAMAQEASDRAVAIAWLGAYETELQRRWTARGRRARLWRRKRSIRW